MTVSTELARYDFRRPDRIPKERLRALHFLYDRFARNLGTSLSAYLRVTTEVLLASVEQKTYKEFLGGCADQTAYYAVSLDPVKGLAALEVNPVAAYAMIDRMLGGRGEAVPVDRGLTDIEQRVVDNVVRLMLKHMTQEWRQVGQVEFAIQRRETRPQLLQISAPNDAVLAVALTLNLAESEGALHFCFPTALLEEMGPGFVDRWRDRGRKQTSDVDRLALFGNLAKVPLETQTVLDTTLPAADLLQLAIGDVVALGAPVNMPVEVRVEGRPKFSGTLTQTPSGMALTITRAAGRPAAGASV